MGRGAGGCGDQKTPDVEDGLPRTDRPGRAAGPKGGQEAATAHLLPAPPAFLFLLVLPLRPARLLGAVGPVSPGARRSLCGLDSAPHPSLCDPCSPQRPDALTTPQRVAGLPHPQTRARLGGALASHLTGASRGHPPARTGLRSWAMPHRHWQRPQRGWDRSQISTRGSQGPAPSQSLGSPATGHHSAGGLLVLRGCLLLGDPPLPLLASANSGCISWGKFLFLFIIQIA